MVLLLVGALNEARKLGRTSLHSNFQFIRNSLNDISLTSIGFSESERKNINLILNNLSPNNKIDFQLVSDNRIAADYKKLFRILHLRIDGGIKDFKKERRNVIQIHRIHIYFKWFRGQKGEFELAVFRVCE